jgi:hypothetical protein
MESFMRRSTDNSGWGGRPPDDKKGNLSKYTNSKGEASPTLYCCQMLQRAQPRRNGANAPGTIVDIGWARHGSAHIATVRSMREEEAALEAELPAAAVPH